MIINGEILKKEIRKKGLTKQQAADMLGISRTMLYNHFNGGELDAQFVQDVHQKLDINLHNVNSTEPFTYNVIEPKGNIVRQQTGNINRKPNALIPFYNADFMAGNAEVYYEDATIYPEYYMDIPEFSGCTAFRAYSDSMETKIRSGNILFGVKIDDWKSHLEYGQIYGITCNDGRRYLKYIRKNRENDKYFLLLSENPNYDEFTIPKEKIKNIWLIEGWLDKRT